MRAHTSHTRGCCLAAAQAEQEEVKEALLTYVFLCPGADTVLAMRDLEASDGGAGRGGGNDSGSDTDGRKSEGHGGGGGGGDGRADSSGRADSHLPFGVPFGTAFGSDPVMPSPLTADELCNRVESWLTDRFGEDVEFDTSDGLDKVLRMGLAEYNAADDTYRALPLHKALSNLRDRCVVHKWAM